MRLRLLGLALGFLLGSAVSGFAQTATYRGPNTGAGAQPVISGYDSGTTDSYGNPVIKPVGASNPLPAALAASQLGIGNVGGKTVSVCVTPPVTASSAYGTNYVIGGLLTFPNVFTSTGSGILQGVAATIKDVETNGLIFFPFNADPTSTTWTDDAVAAINAADVAKVRSPAPLSYSSQLGTHTIAYAYGLGEAVAPGTTSLYGVLIANAALTNNFGSTSDVQVCVKVLDDE